jgi:PAS domain S-box-containing protein
MPDPTVPTLNEPSSHRPPGRERRPLGDRPEASEARLQLALDVAGMGLWQADLKTLEVMWWPGMASIHGLPAGTAPLPMREYPHLIHPDDRESVVQSLRDAIACKSDSRAEYRVVWPDGSVHWIEGRAKLLLDERGEARVVTGVCLDITHRKRIEYDLKFLADASAELAGLSDYQSTLDKIAHLAVPHFADWCMVDLLDENGSLERVAAAHVDATKEHLVRRMQRRCPPEPGRIVGRGTWNVLRTGQTERVSEFSDELLEHAGHDEEYVGILRTLGLISYLGVPLAVRGQTLGLITFVTAESQRRYTAEDQALALDLAQRAAVAIENAKLLRAMQQSDRAKDVFLATLAHELRNPLAPVSTGLSIIRRAPGDAARVEQITGVIERQVTQLTRLVDDLLDVARIKTGKIELKKEPTNLASILRSAIETSRPHMEAGQHSFSVEIPQEPTDIEADPVRLAQVFSNLLNNAARYTPAGGQVDVALRAEPDRYVVYVRDTGPGIPPEMLKEVFGLFTQVTHPAERRQEGLGIGLSLVEGLVRLHGGTVEAHSEGPQKGSEFVVCLPRTQITRRAPDPAGEAGDQAGASQRHRILVVDDNRDAAETLAELLGMLGNEVAVALDGLSAIERVAQFQPDVVLLDIGLPDINGYEVARRVRRLKGIRRPRLIALTGWGQQQDKHLAAQAGFDQHWTKPVDIAQLQELSRAPVPAATWGQPGSTDDDAPA